MAVAALALCLEVIAQERLRAELPAEVDAAVAAFAADPAPNALAQLRVLDAEVGAFRGNAGRQLSRQILVALAVSGHPDGLLHVRSTFESAPHRRADAAFALAQYVLRRKRENDDWRYLLRSLTVVEDGDAADVLRALARFRERATKPRWMRQVILVGLRLPETEQPLALNLLEHWSDQAPDVSGMKPAAALSQWQDWFRERYPDEPDPSWAADPPGARWTLAELRSRFDAADLRHVDRTLGRSLFQRVQCAKCHRVGDLGDRFGPNLTTVGGRLSRPELLLAILFPSHDLPEEYPAVTLVTDNGLIVTGMLTTGEPGFLHVMQPDGTRRSLPQSDVEQVVPLKISAMPMGLLDPLSLDEIAALLGYLEQPAD